MGTPNGRESDLNLRVLRVTAALIALVAAAAVSVTLGACAADDDQPRRLPG